MEDILKDLYYGKSGFMNKQTLFNLASKKDPSITRNDVTNWFIEQDINQIYHHSSNKYDKHAHFYITEPNALHMIDLMYMPNDKSLKYILCVIDVATRYKAAMPLSTKNAHNVLNKLEEIYHKSDYLEWPRQMNCDQGSKFKGDTARAILSHGTKLSVGNTGMHQHNCFVESMNKELAKRLFMHMSHKELQTQKISKTWAEYLQPTIDAMNNEINSSIGKTPTQAMQLEEVKQKIYKVNEAPDIPIRSTVRYLLNKDEIQENHTDKTSFKTRRATDPIYSVKKYIVENYFDQPNNPRLYKLKGLDNRWFVSGSLLEVPMD
jgi:hypothetical protein